MANFVPFQNQLLSIMEILAKAAVAEINRCVDDSCAVFRLEISQSQKEIETLKNKLQVLERELLKTRRQKTAESVFGQEWRLRPRGGENRMVMEDVNISLLPSSSRNQSRCEQLPVKPERLEEDLFRDKQIKSSRKEQEIQPTPEEEEQDHFAWNGPAVDDGKKPDTEPTPAGDLEELKEQHRCGHGDEELSGLEFVVKAEHEEEHVAQRLRQRVDTVQEDLTLWTEYVMYERDNQLWTSFTQGNSYTESNDPVCSIATEQHSQSLSLLSPLHHTPGTMEVSGNTLNSFRAYPEEFSKMGEKLSVCSEELRSEAIHTQQGQYRERLVHTVESENQILLPQQQQHGPSVKHRRGSERPAQPHSGSQNETSSSLSTGAVNTEKRVSKETRADFGRKQFVCKYCGKTYYFHSNLIEHQRFHTGEKPYSCAHCGRCFKRKSHVVDHEKLHSGHRPFVCTQCGKRFARGTHLRRHQKIHT
ncbi:hypothetical protein GJAV_G00093920 [Gymnothorax javanicus]|nr:hypothetical protein GJAV_G00093920 [Gymnothorax javanicus]